MVVKSPFGDDAWPVMVCVYAYECVSDLREVSVVVVVVVVVMAVSALNKS